MNLHIRLTKINLLRIHVSGHAEIPFDPDQTVDWSRSNKSQARIWVVFHHECQESTNMTTTVRLMVCLRKWPDAMLYKSSPFLPNIWYNNLLFIIYKACLTDLHTWALDTFLGNICLEWSCFIKCMQPLVPGEDSEYKCRTDANSCCFKGLRVRHYETFMVWSLSLVKYLIIRWSHFSGYSFHKIKDNCVL